ncbi:MAG: hypothetical protein FWE16_01150 [Firmicutes bacterium]|nr:hypothetical protein [Bacillota bacterium]
MEEIKIVEQSVVDNETENKESMEDPCPNILVNDSTKSGESEYLGTFKNSTQLFLAYENLRKEFTRKSQELASLKKSIEETVADNAGAAQTMVEQATSVESKEKSPEQIIREYLMGVKTRATPPVILGTSVEAKTTLTDGKKDIHEANKAAQTFFQTRL